MNHDWYRSGESTGTCLRCRLTIEFSDKAKVAEHADAECDDGRIIAPLDEEHFNLIMYGDQVDGDVTSSPR